MEDDREVGENGARVRSDVFFNICTKRRHGDYAVMSCSNMINT